MQYDYAQSNQYTKAQLLITEKQSGTIELNINSIVITKTRFSRYQSTTFRIVQSKPPNQSETL